MAASAAFLIKNVPRALTAASGLASHSWVKMVKAERAFGQAPAPQAQHACLPQRVHSEHVNAVPRNALAADHRKGSHVVGHVGECHAKGVMWGVIALFAEGACWRHGPWEGVG